MEVNVRYGVVNIKDRTEYEKKFQLSFGYELTTYDKNKAITFCKNKKSSKFVVEKIFNIPHSKVNNKVIIFRGGEKQ